MNLGTKILTLPDNSDTDTMKLTNPCLIGFEATGGNPYSVLLHSQNYMSMKVTGSYNK